MFQSCDYPHFICISFRQFDWYIIYIILQNSRMSIDSRNNQMAIHFQYSSLPEMHVKLEFKNKMYNQNIKQRAYAMS